MERPAVLELLGEKSLHQKVDPRLVAYNPSMDLLALGSTDQQVLIYRLNGQRVYGASPNAGDLRVDNFCWKPNGQLFAMAWSDGSVRIFGPESNKTVHQFSTGDETSGITCMGWACTRTSRSSESPGSKNALESLEDLLFDGNVLSKSKTALDLPRDLAQIDIERSLPRLSVIPTGSTSEEAFSSRQSLFILFRPFDPNDNDSLDVMVVGTKEGNIHLSIYDSFVIGSFKSPFKVGALPSHLVLHASHEAYSTHALLMRSSESENNLYFMPMDLRFISASSDYLSILSSRSTVLHNLLRYIHQVQFLMMTEWKGTQELPARFLRNINETLGESSNRDIVQALYHSVATGHTFPAVRDWLVDELTERGHKRWDKVVTCGLENLKRLVHENMLPALERCSVILSRFAGIAKFQGSDDIVGFSNHQIGLMMDTVACLNLVYSKILIQVVDELDLFSSFSAWLRFEIDRLVSDPSLSSTNEEGAEKEGPIDHTKVLLYLETTMTTSPLAVYFGPVSETETGDLVHEEQGLPMFNLLDVQLQKQEQGLPYMKHLPRVDFLSNILSQQATTIFGQIAEAEKRNVLFGKATELGSIESGTAFDMKMSPIDYCSFHTHIAVVPKGQPSQSITRSDTPLQVELLIIPPVQVIRITSALENGISTVKSVDSSTVQLGDGRIKDVKFADGFTLFVLWESNELTSLLAIPYRGGAGQNAARYTIPYSPYSTNELPKPTVFGTEELLERFSGCPIKREGSFVPETINVRWQGGKENSQSKRIVIFGNDRMQYKVFRLAVTRAGIGKTSDEDISMS